MSCERLLHSNYVNAKAYFSFQKKRPILMLFILHFQGPRLYETTIQLGAKCKTETILIGPLNFLMEMRTKIQIIGKKLFPSLSLVHIQTSKDCMSFVLGKSQIEGL